MVATARKLSEGEHGGVWLRSEKIIILSKSMVRPWSKDGRDYAQTILPILASIWLVE
jgi:hypothetical protein